MVIIPFARAELSVIVVIETVPRVGVVMVGTGLGVVPVFPQPNIEKQAIKKTVYPTVLFLSFGVTFLKVQCYFQEKNYSGFRV